MTFKALTFGQLHGAGRLASRPRLAFLAVGLIALLTALSASHAQATVVGQTSGGLYVLDTGEPVTLHEGSTTGFGVSPDGKQVVYSAAGAVHIETIETKKDKVVTTPEETGVGWAEVRFAPNGEYIIGRAGYEDEETGEGVSGIFSVKVNGEDITQLTEGQDHWPIMSTNGALAYLSYEPSEGEADLMVIHPSPGNRGVPESMFPGGIFGKKGGIPTFSPDGETILFPQILEGTTHSYLIHMSGATPQEGPCCPKLPIWETETTGLEIQGGSAYRFLLSNGTNTLLSNAPKGGFFALRATEFEGEGIPPEAVQPSFFIGKYKPRLRYDFEEPYRADSAEEIVNGIGLEEEPLQLYAPLLRRENGEVLGDPFFGENMEEFNYTSQGEFALGMGALSSVYPNLAFAFEGDYVDEHNNTRQANASFMHENGFGDVQYARWFQEGEEIWIQYWFWYYFNNGVEGFFDHEGDWEGVQIHLSAASNYVPDAYVFNAHDGARVCAQNEIELTATGGPITYVANGSHASYPAEGLWSTVFPVGLDVVFFEPEVVPAVTPAVEHLAESEPEWINWPGHWGGSETSPRGPGFHGQWAEPRLIEEEADGCFDGYESFRGAQSRATEGTASDAQVGLDLRGIRRTDDGVRIHYRLTQYKAIGRGPVTVLLSVDSQNDEAPPRTLYIHKRSRRGVATVPYPTHHAGSLEVRGSVIASGYRSLAPTVEIGPEG